MEADIAFTAIKLMETRHSRDCRKTLLPEDLILAGGERAGESGHLQVIIERSISRDSRPHLCQAKAVPIDHDERCRAQICEAVFANDLWNARTHGIDGTCLRTTIFVIEIEQIHAEVPRIE